MDEIHVLHTANVEVFSSLFPLGISGRYMLNVFFTDLG